MPPNSKTPNQRIVDAALVLAAQSAKTGRIMLVRGEARRLSKKFPDAAMGEEDIFEYLLQLAIRFKFGVDTSD